MSNRTLVELNHNYCPMVRGDGTEIALLEWARSMARYMVSGDKTMLPRGVTYKGIRHHSDPDPMEGKGDPS